MKYILTLSLLIISFVANGQKLNKPTRKFLKSQIDSIIVDDQKYRWQLMLGELNTQKLDSLKKLPKEKFRERVIKVGRKEIGISRAVSDSLWNLQKKLDSMNVIKFYELVNKYGYPSYKRIKSYESNTISLHLMGEKNFIKFFSVFKREVENGNMPPDVYARWYDRNQLIVKKKQLYGEYDKTFPCVENLETTNSERKKIGLRPLRKNNCK